MTVKQLIQQLNKMPKHLTVGISSGDNSEFEISDYPLRVQHHLKSDFNADEDPSADTNIIKSQPDQWVTVHC